MDDQIHSLIHYLALHPEWAGAAVFFVAFGESLVIVSLFFPGTALLLAAGMLMPTGGLPVLPVLIGAILGAIAGDGVSYWIGLRFGHAVKDVWLFTRHSDLIPRGISFFRRYGTASVFIGRFFGPVRAVVPLAAGILKMSRGHFWAANIGSAIIWAPGVLLPGALFSAIVRRFIGANWVLPLAMALLAAVGIVGLWFYLSRRGERLDDVDDR